MHGSLKTKKLRNPQKEIGDRKSDFTLSTEKPLRIVRHIIKETVDQFFLILLEQKKIIQFFYA
ncbi:hypothetical protein BpHYR1_047977 [Brachionus plicatilis]|uniref:Uncharacterized protein n=1 Tax=Brachionus plicatilis TaxID=10195 RepID=A0A3M7PST2_BRAPC|nr:hypothetical protein BpHYR1_047977 [Brachionus plicatilis]